jgi:hypothetical protein
MKNKLSPQEKKELAYEKDHRTLMGESERGMRRTWAKCKARVNRKYHRKTGGALQKAISPDRIDAVLHLRLLFLQSKSTILLHFPIQTRRVDAT